VAVLVTDPGGSGTFYDLAYLTLKEGKPRHVASAFLGDRVQIQALSVEDGEMVVKMIAHGDDDPMCCPTLQTVARYALQEGELVQTAIEAEGETPGLVGVVWEWTRFVGGDDTIVEVEDPARYTLTLNEDGTYEVLADCNRAGGGYTLKTSLLNLLPGPMTLVECGPGSLYDEYVRMLGDVRTYVRPSGSDQLVLNLFADAGNLFFRPAQATPPEIAGLTGITWQWQSTVDADGKETEVEDPTLYKLILNLDGTFAAQIDCNRGRGTYSAETDAGAIALSLGPITRAACGPDSRDQEYIQALADAVAFALNESGDELRLVLADGAGELVFAPLVHEASLQVPMENTPWKLASYHDGSALADVLDETEITAVFIDGQLTGSAGCNTYVAEYKLSGDKLTLGMAAATRKMCAAPDGIMEQEQAYLTSLGAVDGFQIEDGRLELLDAAGAPVAVYEIDLDSTD
jgi:heat shock protein HslJ